MHYHRHVGVHYIYNTLGHLRHILRVLFYASYQPFTCHLVVIRCYFMKEILS
jgi:hypothetical protein